MVFTDNLAFSLGSLCFAGLLITYVVVAEYLAFKKKSKDYSGPLEAARLPIIMVGLYMFLQALWGQFAWPLPGSDNILFYDPMLAFGIVTTAFGLCIHYKVKFEYVGFLGLLTGIMVIQYGLSAYNLGLTKSPIDMFAMYFLYGVAGLFAYPTALIMERIPSMTKKVPALWSLSVVVFCLALFFASGIAGYTALSAVPAHLASAP